MKQIGIWMDKEKAHLITLKDGTETLKTIFSNIETFRIHGGSGTRFKGGPQDVVQDSKYLEREKHQYKAYFKELAEELKKTDTILLFGPAETAKKFKKTLEKEHLDIHNKIRDLLKADSMTENQTKAFVRDYFG